MSPLAEAGQGDAGAAIKRLTKNAFLCGYRRVEDISKAKPRLASWLAERPEDSRNG